MNLILIFNFLDIQDKVLATIENDFEKFLHPNILKIFEEEKLNANDIRDLYFKKGMSFEEIREKYVDLFGDLFFDFGIHKIIHLLTKNNSAPVYVYHFTYDEGFSIVKTMINSNMKGNIYF